MLDAKALDAALDGLDPEQIAGAGGLITQLAGRVINAALEAEMDDHLGRPHGGRCQPPQRFDREDVGDRARRRRDRHRARPGR